MAYEVEVTDEFIAWLDTLDEPALQAIAAKVGLLEELGPQLEHPHSSRIGSSRHGHLRELRVQYRGRPLRILYAFDPRRVAILLIGGEKTGRNRWYQQYVPVADRLYDEHLRILATEQDSDG